MKGKRNAGWKLNPKDVIERSGWSGSRRLGAGKHSRLSVMSGEITANLMHVPTKISVEKARLFNSDSKAERKRIAENLILELYSELEAKVAQFLRVSGR